MHAIDSKATVAYGSKSPAAAYALLTVNGALVEDPGLQQ